jgi:hypothetical protein
VGAFAAGASDDPVSRLAALTNTDTGQVRTWLQQVLGDADIDRSIRRYEGELVYLLLADLSFHADLTMPGLGAFRGAPPEGSSAELRAVLAADWTRSGTVAFGDRSSGCHAWYMRAACLYRLVHPNLGALLLWWGGRKRHRRFRAD